MEKVYLFVIVTIIISSCTFEYERVTLNEDERLNTPNVALINFTEQVYEDDVRILELSSSLVQVFERRRLQEIQGLEFTQFNDDGELVVEGNAGYASRDLDNDDILLSDNVYISIPDQNIIIRGEEFLFSPDQNLVWSPRDSEVFLRREDGTEFTGMGFLFDILLQELRFDGGAEGVLTEDSDEESENSEAVGENEDSESNEPNTIEEIEETTDLNNPESSENNENENS